MTATTSVAVIRLCDRCFYPGDQAFLQGYVVWDTPCARCRRPEGHAVVDRACLDPRADGRGPLTFSTTIAVERWPAWVWDTNRYYSDLGVSFRATKSEIRQAYQRANGAESVRLTFIVKQLLDDEVRAAYDSTPYGSVFFDEVMLRVVKDRIAAEMAKSRMDGVDEDDLVEVDVERLIGKPFQVVDRSPGEDDHGASSHWGFYRWNTPASNAGLATWRGLLGQALHERGEHFSISVGLAGSMEDPWAVEWVGTQLVVFLSDREEPTESYAKAAAHRVVAEHTHPEPVEGDPRRYK